MPTGIARKKSFQVGATPRWTLSTSVSGDSTRTPPTMTSSSWVMKSVTASPMFTAADSWAPRTLTVHRTTTTTMPNDDVGGRGAQRLPEQAADVVRDEERRDGDRHRVVQHLGPGGEEGPELVEGVAGEGRRPARLRVHGRGLGVGGRGQVEDEAGDDEHHRREAEREGGDEPERVVDRRADVPVGGREERVDAQDALEAVESAFGHVARRSLGAVRVAGRRRAPTGRRRRARGRPPAPACA